MDDNHICRVYIPLCNPKYFDCKIFNQLQQDIEHFFDRISSPWKYSDTLSQGGKGVIANDDLWNQVFNQPQNSFDRELNNHGRKLL